MGHNIIPHHHHSEFLHEFQNHHHDDCGIQHADGNPIQLAYGGLAHIGTQAIYNTTGITYIHHNSDKKIYRAIDFSLFSWVQNNSLSNSKTHSRYLLSTYLFNLKNNRFLRGPPQV
ncbi:hypothetical protein [Elizabethkingia sp. HX QKY]|uniref:hypothetical protein n=1 Tax=Elizabethkingia sp. HX QKY TaxID=3003195 RepID=UPI002A249E1F|nr:hypothetical protein [Elizabethkingia sp. HX QKY]